MDGVIVVSGDEGVDGIKQKDYSKDCICDAYRNERSVILRQELDEGGRATVA